MHNVLQLQEVGDFGDENCLPPLNLIRSTKLHLTTDKLKLPINREKSGIRRPVQFGLLGYRFVPMYKKGETGKYQLVVSEKGWEGLKRDLKFVTRKTAPSTFDERIAKLKEIQRGWVNYFRMGSIQAKLKEIDPDSNREKKTERKRKNLIRLGIPTGQAYAWSRTRMGGWAVAQSPIMVTTITLKRLIQRGYESLLDYYERVSPQLNEPLYTRPAWPALRNRRVQWSAYIGFRQIEM